MSYSLNNGKHTDMEATKLRQRAVETTKADGEVATPLSPLRQSELDHRETIARLIASAPTTINPSFARALQKAQPALTALQNFINIVGPFYLKLFELIAFAKQTLPTEILTALVGLGMCFFGGAYCASIAAVEAFLLTGWMTTRAAIVDVWDDVLLMRAATAEDSKKDDDDDGVADATQGTPAERLARKARVAALAVRDPEKLTTALGGLYCGWVAVQGTLRLQFAKTITLGVSIAKLLEAPALRVLVPLLAPLVPADLRHWLPTSIRAAMKAVAVFVAWQVQVMVSAVQSALRGGLLFSRAALAYARKNGHLDQRIADAADEARLVEVVGYAVALFGFYTQFVHGFGLPFPFNIVMLPFTLVEWYVRWSMTS